MVHEITELVGKTLTSVVVNSANDEMLFTTFTGEQYKLYHDQDCCESVSISEIIGDLSDLLNVPLLMAEEVSNEDAPVPESHDDSYTWTFYKFATVKGYVTVRWYGESNGYYSESVDFCKVT